MPRGVLASQHVQRRTHSRRVGRGLIAALLLSHCYGRVPPALAAYGARSGGSRPWIRSEK
jgi:hypothetical protein